MYGYVQRQIAEYSTFATYFKKQPEPKYNNMIFSSTSRDYVILNKKLRNKFSVSYGGKLNKYFYNLTCYLLGSM